MKLADAAIGCDGTIAVDRVLNPGAHYEMAPVGVTRLEEDMNTNYSAAQLMHFAEEGLLDKFEMAHLLPPAPEAEFLRACADIERGLTQACIDLGDHCLASGCAMQGESCLNAILKAGPEYNKACGRVWVALFSNPVNRDKA